MSITALIVLVIWVLVICAVVALLIWVIDYAAGAFGLPGRLAMILKAIVVIVAVLIVITWLVGILPAPPNFRLE